MANAFITPEVLKWARKRANLSQEALAKKVGVRLERIAGWECGEFLPTFRQAQNFANACHVPFGYLFLPSPPEERLDVPDLRTIGGEEHNTFSPEFIDTYHDLVRKQDWFREYRSQEGFDSLSFIGAFSTEDNYRDVAKNICQLLSIDDELRRSAKNWEEFIGKIVEQAELAGIVVMRSSIVGGNTHRPLSVDEFRGLALSDPVAPLLFINTADAKSAQVFTLAHELAHLWIGASGISNPQLWRTKDFGHNNLDETFCNKVATETLVPEELFFESWVGKMAVEGNLISLSTKFRVSQMVIARRGYDLGFLNYDQFKEFYLDALRFDRLKKRKLAESPGGPTHYTTQKVRNGKLFSQSVLAAAFSGRLPLRDAGNLLGVKPGNLRNYAGTILGR